MPPGASPCRGTMHFGRYLVRSGLMAGPSSRDHLLRHTISVPSSSFLHFWLMPHMPCSFKRTSSSSNMTICTACRVATHPLTSFKEESDLAKASNPLPTCNHPEKSRTHHGKATMCADTAGHGHLSLVFCIISKKLAELATSPRRVLLFLWAQSFPQCMSTRTRIFTTVPVPMMSKTSIPCPAATMLTTDMRCNCSVQLGRTEAVHGPVHVPG